MPRVLHFEISADDPQKLTRFYEDVFGWKTDKWQGPMDYWLMTTGPEGEPGIDGAIQPRQDPAARTVITVDVPSIDDAMEAIEEKGGAIVTDKITIPGVGYAAYFQDPQGNVLGLMESDPDAR